MNDEDARRRNHWVNHIGRHAHEKPGAVFLRFEDRSTTWAQLHERVSAVAAAMRRLRRRGRSRGDGGRTDHEYIPRARTVAALSPGPLASAGPLSGQQAAGVPGVYVTHAVRVGRGRHPETGLR
jgi:hypothetical protein